MKNIDPKGIEGPSSQWGRSCLKRIRPVAGMAMVLILLSLPAQGHVLEGPHILELMAQTLAGAKTLKVEQQVMVEDDAFLDQSLTLSETLIYAFPDRFRSDTRSEESSRIYVQSGSASLTIVDGYRTEAGASRYDKYINLLLHRSRTPLHIMLLSNDVDVEKTSLGRFEDRVVYVVGAQYPDESISQVWVDKESLLPLRWIDVSRKDPQDRVEFIYREWQKRNNLWYPTRIEIRHRQVPVRRIVVAALQVDIELSNDLFDMALLLQAFPSEEQRLPLGPTETDVDEVERTIEQFQKKFED